MELWRVKKRQLGGQLRRGKAGKTASELGWGWGWGWDVVVEKLLEYNTSRDVP